MEKQTTSNGTKGLNGRNNKATVTAADNSLSVNNASADTTTDAKDNNELSAPDGGWGWVIVFGSLMTHIILFGIEKSSGIFYLQFEEKFSQSAAVTAWMTTLPVVLRLVLGPMCGILINRFSCRPVTIVGAVLFGLSLVLTAFTTDLTVTIFTFSILGGLGKCLLYSPAVIVVNRYFTNKRGLATGIATSSFGSFLFPTVIEFLFDFYGYLGAFLILAGITLNIVVCGSLFRPLLMDTDNSRQTSFNQDQRNSNQQRQIQSNENKTHEEKCCGSPCPDGCMHNFMCKLKKLLTDSRFITLVIALCSFSIAFQSAFVFIPLYAKQINIREPDTAYTVGVTILFDGFGRIFFGAVLDIRFIRKYRPIAYNFLFLLVGITSLTFPLASTFIELCIICAIYGFIMGGLMSQKSVIIVDIIGLENIADAFGVLLFFQGVGTCVGPSISGLMKDISGSTNGGFYFGGICTIGGAAIFATANMVNHFKHNIGDSAVYNDGTASTTETIC